MKQIRPISEYFANLLDAPEVPGLIRNFLEVSFLQLTEILAAPSDFEHYEDELNSELMRMYCLVNKSLVSRLHLELRVY